MHTFIIFYNSQPNQIQANCGFYIWNLVFYAFDWKTNEETICEDNAKFGCN